MNGNMPDWYYGDRDAQDLMEMGCTRAESAVVISDIEAEIKDLETQKEHIECQIDNLNEQLESLKTYFN